MSYQRLFLCGNIGAGKSTLLKYLASTYSIKTEGEPIGRLINIGGHNLLEEYYKDPPKYAVLFQIGALNEYFKRDHRIVSTKQHQHVVCDRVTDEVAIFTNVMRQTGLLDSVQYSYIMQCYEEKKAILERAGHSDSKFVYVNTEPSVCIQRVGQRGRMEEMSARDSYMNDLIFKLDNEYNMWMRKFEKDRVVYTKGLEDMQLKSKFDSLFHM